MAFFSTEVTTEILLFSVDAIFSYVLLKCYNKTAKHINCLQEVSAKNEVDFLLEDQSKENKKYVMLKGPVKALKTPIPSQYVSDVSGVVQRLSKSELVMKRNSSGFWWDESRLIHQSYNTVPFAIIVNSSLIEVQEVLMADELHLDTVYDKYERTLYSIAGNLWSYFFGVRQNGVKTIEEMLKEGTVVTCIGDLLVAPDGSRSLMPPTDGKPYFITTQSVSRLLENCRANKSLFGVLLFFTGGLTIIFGGLLARNIYNFMKKRKEARDMQRRLDESRKLRRQNVREINELPDSLRCVVCQENPKEVIMLPCGHVCACEDCSEKLGSSCPICRSHVQTKAAAFLS